MLGFVKISKDRDSNLFDITGKKEVGTNGD